MKKKRARRMSPVDAYNVAIAAQEKAIRGIIRLAERLHAARKSAIRAHRRIAKEDKKP